MSYLLFSTPHLFISLIWPPCLCVMPKGSDKWGTVYPWQSLAVKIHCEFWSRFHSDSKRIQSGFELKRRESPRIGRVFTVIYCETLSWVVPRTTSKVSYFKMTICNSHKRYCVSLLTTTVGVTVKDFAEESTYARKRNRWLKVVGGEDDNKWCLTSWIGLWKDVWTYF